MGKHGPCKRCGVLRHSGSSRMECFRKHKVKFADDDDPQPLPHQRELDIDSSTSQSELEGHIEALFEDFDTHRHKYYNFYNDYRRNGVSDAADYAPKSNVMPPSEKIEANSSLEEAIAELVQIKTATIPFKVKGIKQEKLKGKDTILTHKQNLTAYFHRHLKHIQTFEQLLSRQHLSNWDQEKKQNKILSKKWEASDARSRLRQYNGKDNRSTKRKYAILWKILTDPLTRIMLSDRFMETWHDKIFPTFINPYKFRRLENQLRLDQKYYQDRKFRCESLQKYEVLSANFQKLSKELIELKTNVFPFSLKNSMSQLIKSKEEKIRQIEQQLQEQQLSPQLKVLPPNVQSRLNDREAEKIADSSYFPYLYPQDTSKKRREKELKQIEEHNASVRQKKWLKQTFKNHALSQSVMRYGPDLGPSMALASVTGSDLNSIINIDNEIKRLKNRCFKMNIPIDDILQFQADNEPSVELRKKLLVALRRLFSSKRLTSTPSEFSLSERIHQLKEQERKRKPIEKRTLYENMLHLRFIKRNKTSNPQKPEIMTPETTVTSNKKAKFDRNDVQIENIGKQSKRSRRAKNKCLFLFSQNKVKVTQRAPYCAICKKSKICSDLMWQSSKIICSRQLCPFFQEQPASRMP